MRADCYEWPGSVDGNGYGQFQSGGVSYKPHRVVFEAAWGPIPAGHVIRHKCDNPRCINPAHLESGTPADNVRDMWDRGRGHLVLKGEVLEDARRRFMAGETFEAIGRDIGVTGSAISKVCKDIAPGRGSYVKKLTWDMRQEIRRRVGLGEKKSHLAREFGVTHGAINHTLKHGKVVE